MLKRCILCKNWLACAHGPSDKYFDCRNFFVERKLTDEPSSRKHFELISKEEALALLLYESLGKYNKQSLALYIKQVPKHTID